MPSEPNKRDRGAILAAAWLKDKGRCTVDQLMAAETNSGEHEGTILVSFTIRNELGAYNIFALTVDLEHEKVTLVSETCQP